MDLVTEGYRLNILLPGEIIAYRLENGMALLTVILNRKRILAIVAHSTGGTIFHFGHGVASIIRPRDKRLVVTVVTAVNAKMKLVTEQSTRIPEGDILDRVTSVT